MDRGDSGLKPVALTRLQFPGRSIYCGVEQVPYKSKEDRRACAKRYYDRDPKRQVRRSKAFNQKRARQIQELIATEKQKPCTDCKQTFPNECMDFDHVRGQKRFNVGNMKYTGYAIKTVLTEIAKCELVCANCHRIRTATRRVGASPTPATS